MAPAVGEARRTRIDSSSGTPSGDGRVRPRGRPHSDGRTSHGFAEGFHAIIDCTHSVRSFLADWGEGDQGALLGSVVPVWDAAMYSRGEREKILQTQALCRSTEEKSLATERGGIRLRKISDRGSE